MITDKYITIEEMTEIQTLCRRLDALSETLDGLSLISTSILLDDEGGYRTFVVGDVNGEVLGHLGGTEQGFGLYLDDGVEVEDETEEPPKTNEPLDAGETCPECGQSSSGYHIPGASLNCVKPRSQS